MGLTKQSVKNPVNPDLSLWLGAIERLQSANISRLGLIHKVFHLKENPVQKCPEWQVAIETKNKFLTFQLFDPSHISGRRDLIFDLRQMALDLSTWFDVETHIDPDNA